jgi:hypothetical protein
VKQGDANVNHTMYGQNNGESSEKPKPNSMHNVGNVAANQDEAREKYHAMLD